MAGFDTGPEDLLISINTSYITTIKIGLEQTEWITLSCDSWLLSVRGIQDYKVLKVDFSIYRGDIQYA